MLQHPILAIIHFTCCNFEKNITLGPYYVRLKLSEILTPELLAYACPVISLVKYLSYHFRISSIRTSSVAVVLIYHFIYEYSF